jgi:hypothetical protein
MMRVLDSAQHLFPSISEDLKDFPEIPRHSRREYILLVAEELKARKLDLFESIEGGGTVFGVPKSSNRVRAVWHGRAVSEAAEPPPKPRHLASPTALLDLETQPNAPYYMCKRDGRSMFDQLAAPAYLHNFFGRPGFYLQELLDTAGLNIDELIPFWRGPSPLSGKTFVYPAARVWSMGFSWSSCISQEVALTCCYRAGLTPTKVLALTHWQIHQTFSS